MQVWQRLYAQALILYKYKKCTASVSQQLFSVSRDAKNVVSSEQAYMVRCTSGLGKINKMRLHKALFYGWPMYLLCIEL